MAKSPYTTQHSEDAAWPLTLAVNAQGQSVHACADCGTEIPDGVVVERDSTTRRVSAYRHGGRTSGNDPVRTSVHDCRGPKGPQNG